MCPTHGSHGSHATPCTQPIFSSYSSRFSIPRVPVRLGRHLRRSNTYDTYGFHPWSEYSIQEVHTDCFMFKSLPPESLGDSLVDHCGLAMSFPGDLAMRWVFQNPDNGDTEVIYAQDTELWWTEVLAGARSGVVPARYVPEIAEDGSRQGPMTREWFLDMVSQFTVDYAGRLMRDGLEVCKDYNNFEWKAIIMLDHKIVDLDLAYYTPEHLVNAVRKAFGLWHLDSFNRACAVLNSFNAVSPLPFDPSTPHGISLYSRIGFNVPSPPPHYQESISSQESHLLDLHIGFNSVPLPLSSASITSFPVVPDDSAMDSEDGI